MRVKELEKPPIEKEASDVNDTSSPFVQWVIVPFLIKFINFCHFLLESNPEDWLGYGVKYPYNCAYNSIIDGSIEETEDKLSNYSQVLNESHHHDEVCNFPVLSLNTTTNPVDNSCYQHGKQEWEIDQACIKRILVYTQCFLEVSQISSWTIIYTIPVVNH